MHVKGECLVVNGCRTAVLRYLEERVLRDTKSIASVRASIVSTRLPLGNICRNCGTGQYSLNVCDILCAALFIFIRHLTIYTPVLQERLVPIQIASSLFRSLILAGSSIKLQHDENLKSSCLNNHLIIPKVHSANLIVN